MTALRGLMSSLFGSVAIVAFAQTDFIVNNIRIQFLKSDVVRVEEKGPKGFENRETFNILRPYWGQVSVNKSTSGSFTIFKTDALTVRVHDNPTSLMDVEVFDSSGFPQFQYDGKKPVPHYLPSPSQPQNYVIADFPRMVPPVWGATPPPIDNKNHTKTSGWDLSNEAPDFYIFAEPSARDLYKDLIRLTGPTEMPPLYLFGFWNSRWEPYTAQTATAEMKEYRKRNFPLDLFVLDTNWRVGGSHGYDVATNLFPDMKGFMDQAHKMGVKIMMNDHPEPVGPAASPEELGYRWKGLDSQFKNGLNVWWFDRNWSTHLGTPAPGLALEVWGMRMYHDMTEKAHPELRPMIMSNVSGIDNGHWDYAPGPAAHRYPIWWTGDTSSQFVFLQRGIRHAINSGVLTLTPYVSEDLGGHIGVPDPELYTRYLEYGSLSPVDRVHCTYELTRVPWAFGADAEQTVRRYIKLRYRLQPTFYQAAHQNYLTGLPMLRRLDLYWPQAPIETLDNEYLLGKNLLVAPVYVSQQPTSKVIPSDMFVGGNLHGEYFNNSELSGAPTFSRNDSNIDFDWSKIAPGPGVSQDKFSVRWKGTIGPINATGDYTISTTTDDGVRLFIDNKELINYWVPQDDVTHRVKVHLVAGSTYKVELDYNQVGGNALCKLGWIPPSMQIEKPTRNVWIPEGQWVDLWTGKTLVGPTNVNVDAPLNICPVFAKSGAIVLTAPDMMYTHQRPWDPITVDAYEVEAGNSSQTLYEDDGNTVQYKQGGFAETAISCHRLTNEIRLNIGARTGSYEGMISKRGWVIRIHVSSKDQVNLNGVLLDGKHVQAQLIAPGDVPKIILKGGTQPDGPDGGSIVYLRIRLGSPLNSHLIQVPLINSKS